MISIDETSFFVIVGAAAFASLFVLLIRRWAPIPVVVVELLLGIIIGPQVLDLATPDDFISFFAELGLGMLFFFAGFEIDFQRIKGAPLRLAGFAWAFSLVLAYGIGGILAAAGIVLSLVYTGSALATTAIGTLLPILRDAGELRTRFGTFLLSAGAVGEFGPILLITLVLSSQSTAKNAAILIVFVALAVLAAVVAVRSINTTWSALESSIESSGQAAVRVAVLLVFGMVALASELGLDILLGGFVAGIITRLALQGREVVILESKLTAVGYGFFIPFFFIVSGMRFDLDSLVESPGAMAKLVLFFFLFLVVRGVPALVLYRKVLDGRDRAALAFFSSTQLPLVVAITTIAVDAGEMRASTSAALVGAAILSTMVFPLVGLHLRKGRVAGDLEDLPADDPDARPPAAPVPVPA
jgi:Kef-type K+ transport system membrane component KefB